VGHCQQIPECLSLTGSPALPCFNWTFAMTDTPITPISPVETRLRGDGVRIVYDQLKTEILTLALAPGQHLDETNLANRFKMSRSPIREAIIRLAGEGLLVTLSNRATQVAPLDLLGFPKYIEALDLLQRANTRLAAAHRSDSDIAAIRLRMAEFEAAVRRNDYLEMSEANLRFHVAIAEAGRNPYLTREYERLLSEGRRMLHLHFDYLSRSQDEFLLTDEHPRILQAIIDRDVERADDLAHDHTRQFRDRFLQYMRQNSASEMRLARSLS